LLLRAMCAAGVEGADGHSGMAEEAGGKEAMAVMGPPKDGWDSVRGGSGHHEITTHPLHPPCANPPSGGIGYGKRASRPFGGTQNMTKPSRRFKCGVREYDRTNKKIRFSLKNSPSGSGV